jgi:DNA helicase-2/ATP-dependent DNA helicase PcrA
MVNYLKGLFSDKIEDKISASFTSFSRYSMKESFELSEAYHREDMDKLKKLENWGIELKKNDVDSLFDKVIFPICVSKGGEWLTTAVVLKRQIDEYLLLGIPTREDLFDFISIAEESYVERDAGSKITLTTVHKAKGRDFDVVIYLPSFSLQRTSFVDLIVEKILESNGIDVREELEEESLRIDFVAFTRAKEKLVIITDGKNAGRYHIEKLSEMEIDDKQDEIVAHKLDDRLSEAYALFLEGRFQESERLLKSEDGWLKEFIFDYFKKMDHFSYSRVQTDAYDFLINNIISIPNVYPAADFGSKVHSAVANTSNNNAVPDDFEGDVKMAIQNSTLALDHLKGEFPGLKISDVEKKIELPLHTMIECSETNLFFKGTIDAIFRYDKGYLIVDYKTDKKTTNASSHKRQLAVYRKMLSIMENIAEDQIKVAVVFLALRGGINTGRFDWEIHKEVKNSFPTFEKHLNKILDWKRNPEKFITDLVENPREDLLYERIREKILL